jgi:glutathione S-transferase
MRYLGRKYGLMGRTETENIRIDIIENQIEDFRYNGLRNVVYLPVFDKSLDFEKLREEYLSNIDNYLKEISHFLSDNQWMAGNHITYVDFWAYEILDWNRLFKSDCLNKHQNLAEYLERFESLPAIKQYINSSEFKRFPIFAPYAKWGG